MAAMLPLVCLMVAGASGLLLDDNGSLQVQLEQERQARIQLQAQVIDLQSKMRIFEESINSECTLQCPTRTDKSVAFMAQLSQNLVNPAVGHVVIFDNVTTNEGNGYNSLHGIFTAPVNGTYNFNLIASSQPGTADHQMHVYIMNDGKQVGYVFFDWNTQRWLRRSTDITLRLNQGSEIWVQVGYIKGDHILNGCCLHTHLSGFLIRAE